MVGIVLAGGESTRFGREKLAFRIDGVPVLRRTFDAVRRVDPRVFVSVHRRPQVERLHPLLPPGAQFLVDLRSPGMAGPGAGIVTGLRASTGERVLTVAGDMPWVEPGALRRLLGFAGAGGPGIAVPLHPPGIVEPLVQAHQTSPETGFLDRLIEGRTHRLRPTDLLRSSGSVRLVGEQRLARSARCFKSVNTPGDLEVPRRHASTAVGRSVIRVPREAAIRFWRATDRLSRGDRVGAGQEFSAEAEIYRQTGVPHLELHCLMDARAAFGRDGGARASVDRRIPLLRLVLSSPSELASARVGTGARSSRPPAGPSGSR